MEKRLEVDIQVIIHATEDIDRIFGAFKQVFDVDQEEFSSQTVQGHFENPIILLSCKLKKKKSKNFVKTLISKIPRGELKLIVDDLQNRCDGSALHLRISKQSLVKGKVELADIDPVKLKIYTPVYTQKDLAKTYSEILNGTI
jgi:hypothetical protein